MSQTRRVFQFFRQEEATPAALRGATVVVIDVLRASSSITTALACGAKEVRCFRSVRAALQARRRFERARDGSTGSLLCGERNGVRIPGFDLGNSPREYTKERCAGQVIFMTTTNGTRAMQRTRQARDVVIGCFLNLKALTKYLLAERGDIALLCAGTEGDLSEEDVCCAGAIACRLAAKGLDLTAPAQEAARLWSGVPKRGLGSILSAQTTARLMHYKKLPNGRQFLRRFLAHSRGGAPLVKLGLGRDIPFCAQVDRFAFVPRLAMRNADRGVRKMEFRFNIPQSAFRIPHS